VERRAPEGKVGAATLSADELAESGRLGTPDALGRAGTLMGVSRQRPMADLHVQGGAAGEHQVRLDGMPIRNPVTLRRLLGAFSPLALDRLTVRKAGFGVEHGSRLSGVIAAEHALAPSGDRNLTVQADPLSANGAAQGRWKLPGGRSASAMIAATFVTSASSRGSNARTPRWSRVDSREERIDPRFPPIPIITGTRTSRVGLSRYVAFSSSRT